MRNCCRSQYAIRPYRLHLGIKFADHRGYLYTVPVKGLLKMPIGMPGCLYREIRTYAIMKKI